MDSEKNVNELSKQLTSDFPLCLCKLKLQVSTWRLLLEMIFHPYILVN